MPWKVYFYFYLTASVLSFLLQLSSIPDFKLYDWLVFIETILTPIALYAFVFKKKLSDSTKNSIILIFSLLWIVTIVYYFLLSSDLRNQLDFLSSSGVRERGEIIRGVLLNIPMFYVMYQLFIEKKTTPKSKKKKKS